MFELQKGTIASAMESFDHHSWTRICIPSPFSSSSKWRIPLKPSKHNKSISVNIKDYLLQQLIHFSTQGQPYYCLCKPLEIFALFQPCKRRRLPGSFLITLVSICKRFHFPSCHSSEANFAKCTVTHAITAGTTSTRMFMTPRCLPFFNITIAWQEEKSIILKSIIHFNNSHKIKAWTSHLHVE